jgi:hypothetical protein
MTLSIMFALICICSMANAEAFDFYVIQPGQPGTQKEAQPVMDALAEYLGQKIGKGKEIKGVYFNDLDQALEAVKKAPPRWSIVSLSFYAGHSKSLHLTPLASTIPGGHKKDKWHLAVSKNASDNWRTLSGEVSGTMFTGAGAEACILFQKKQNALPFKLTGTLQPLRSLKNVVEGKAAGVVLDRQQFEAVKALPIMDSIKTIHQSEDLPTSPVVWFGNPDEYARQLISALMGMRGDPNASALLQLLQTEGFGPADAGLNRFAQGVIDEGCSP